MLQLDQELFKVCPVKKWQMQQEKSEVHQFDFDYEIAYFFDDFSLLNLQS